jgi:hypothetical protein
VFSEALAYPRSREGAASDLLVGGLLVLASPLVVPLLAVLGYQLRVMDAAARGREYPPLLGDWDRLLADGLKAAVVVAVWGLLPLVVVLAGTAGVAVAFLPVQGPLTAPFLAVGQVTTGQWALAGVVVGSLVALAAVLWLHLPAAMVAVATQGRLGAAFQTGALWAVVSTRQYVGGVALAAVVAGAGSFLALLFVPVLVGFVVQFYVQVAVAYVLGRAVGGAAVTAIQVA